MFMNNRILEKNEENVGGNRPEIATQIYELCRLLSDQQKTVDGSCCGSIFETSLSAPPNVPQFSKQNMLDISSPEDNESSASTSSSNTVLFDAQKHTNSPVPFNCESLGGNDFADVENRDSPLHFESNTKEGKRPKEFTRPVIIQEDPNDKSDVGIMENDLKPTTSFISVAHPQFEAQVRDKLNLFENRRSLETDICNDINLMYDTLLKHDQFSSDLRLHSEDTVSSPESSNGIQESIFDSKCLDGLNELFHETGFYTGEQKPFSFDCMDSPNAGFQKDTNLRKTFLYSAGKLEKQCEELKSNHKQVLNSTKTENKQLDFNFSLDLQNQRKYEGDNINLDQKVSRKQSASSNDDFISKIEENYLLVSTTWQGRKCKSEVRIPHETNNIPAAKFPTDKNSTDTNLDLKSSNRRKSAESVGSSTQKRIPTFRGHKLPAKVSVLLLNGPIRLNFTENISGKSQEILMCTSDVIEEVTRIEKDIQQRDIVKRLLARSRPYIGKPVHIIFEPTKAEEFFSPVDSFEGNPVPLHPSPAKHNLLAKEPEAASARDYRDIEKTDAEMTSGSYWENSSDETLVVKQKDPSKEIGNRMAQGRTDSPGLDASARQNDRLATSSCARAMEPQVKKKLKIRLCKRNKSLTSLKRVNVKQIVNSVFRNFFHFYSVLGGHLRSGSVITKWNSVLWLRKAGVAADARSLETANELFRNIAGAKLVLNIFDYMQFLTVFARRQRIATVDLIKQLTICELPVVTKIQRKQSSESRRLKPLPQSKHSEQGRTEVISIQRSQSLPNLKTSPLVYNS